MSDKRGVLDVPDDNEDGEVTISWDFVLYRQVLISQNILFQGEGSLSEKLVMWQLAIEHALSMAIGLNIIQEEGLKKAMTKYKLTNDYLEVSDERIRDNRLTTKKMQYLIEQMRMGQVIFHKAGIK